MKLSPQGQQSKCCGVRAARVICGILLTLVFGFASPESLVCNEKNQQQKHVLILYSFENEVGLFSGFDQSLRATLKAGRVGHLKFYTEFLDLVRFNSHQQETQLQSYLRTKYSGVKIDLVIPVSLPAVQFILRRGKDLFHGAPIVFCTVDRRWTGRTPLPANVTGIVETTKIDKTLAAALRLQPDTRRVVVVGGALPYEQDWMRELQKDLRQREGKLRFTYLTGLPMDNLLKTLSSLPEHTIILYTMMWQDGAGENFLPSEALQRITQSADAPVYGIFEKYLGSGLTGGDLVDLKKLGNTVAEMGLQILRGEKPADMPVLSKDDGHYVFDWRKLQRWHISEARLPPQSTVQFRKATFWQLYKWLIINVILLICVETILIVLLLIQRRKRKRAEAGLRNSEARYLAFVSNSSEGIARFESDQPMPVSLSEEAQVTHMLQHSYLAECNEAFARMHGIAMPQHFNGMRLAQLLLPSEAQNLDFLRAFVRSGYRLLDNVTHERDEQGNIHWFDHRATGILEDGHLARMWTVQRDVTERKLAAEVLKQQASFNELMTGILARFATCQPVEVDASVVEALHAIAEFIGADHAFVVRLSADRTQWSCTHEWCGVNVSPRIEQFQCMPLGTMPQKERRILAGEVVRINSPDEYPADAIEDRRNQKAEGHLSALDVPMRTKAGIFGCIGLHSHAEPLTWADNSVTCLRMVGDAVATALERKQSLEELGKSEEKFSKAFHSSPVAMTILSLATGHYIGVNRTYERNTGYRSDEIIGRTPEQLGIYDNLADMERIKLAMETQASLRNQEIQYRTKGGDRRIALLSTEMIDFDGEPCMLKVSEDITERKKVEKTLRELGARMLMVQEEERRRVARELHDDFSQRLALLAIDLEQLAQRPPATRQDWDSRIRSMWSQTQELTSDIHRLSHQLHPSKLEDLGLVMAVRSYCHELSRQTKLEVKFSDGNVPRSLPREIALCLYRIVQEALRNVVKHSGSRSAIVELEAGTGEIALAVSDSGKGFDLEAARGSDGLGLASMRERVRSLGGELTICSRPSEGTRVAVRIPLAPVES